MAFGDADLGVFFALTGVPVQFGGQSTRGNLDEAGVTAKMLGLTVQDASHALELARGSLFPMPVPKDKIVVDGRPFIVRALNPVDDGAVVVLELRQA